MEKLSQMNKNMKTLFIIYFLPYIFALNEKALPSSVTGDKGQGKRVLKISVFGSGECVLACYVKKISFMYSFSGLRGLDPNFLIHVSVIDLYIPRIGPHIPAAE